MGTSPGIHIGAKLSGIKRGAGYEPLNVSHRYSRRSKLPAVDLDHQLEHRRWSNVMAQDHRLLRQLLERLELVEQSRQRAMLVALALDFHEMHSAFEAEWVRIAELEPARNVLDDLAEKIGHASHRSARFSALVVSWKARLIVLMQQEEIIHLQKTPGPSPVGPWSTDMLDWRISLCSEIRASLVTENYHGTV